MLCRGVGLSAVMPTATRIAAVRHFGPLEQEVGRAPAQDARGRDGYDRGSVLLCNLDVECQCALAA